MEDVHLSDWLASLAAKQPTPGGGAVAALSAAIAAAQLAMVANYTTGEKWQDRETHMKALANKLDTLRGRAIALVEADAEAFASVSEVYKLPKETDDEKALRKSAIQSALVGAAQPPRQTAELAAQLVVIAEELAEAGNPNVISDVAVGASLAKAALEAAIVNIEINQQQLGDGEGTQSLQQAIEQATEATQRADMVVETVRKQLAV